MGTTDCTQPRMTWMDLLRGTAIALVILWHSAAILLLFKHPVPNLLLQINEVFAPYRMPTLMLLSGMLLPQSVAKRLSTYYVGKLRYVAYPLVIWTVITFVQLQPKQGIFSFNYLTTTYLWFLVYIFVYYLAGPLLRWIPPWVGMAVAITVTFYFNDPDDEARRRFFFLAIFFLLGAWVTAHRTVLDRVVGSARAWLLAPIALGFGLFSALTAPDRYLGVYAIFSLAGVLTMIKLAQRFAGHRLSRSIQYVGRHSLTYYVTHFPVIVLVVQIGIGKWGMASGPVIVVGFIAGFAVGTGAAWLSDHSPVRWLFIAPVRGDLALFRRRSASSVGQTNSPAVDTAGPPPLEHDTSNQPDRAPAH